MTPHRVGVPMNGVTGRMGTNQHPIRSLLAIRAEGGVPLPGGDAIWPEPVLVGRSEHKLRALAEAHGLERWTTDLEDALADPSTSVYFDAQTTVQRAEAVRAAILAGKHVYCEKPFAGDLGTALELGRLARKQGVKQGVVQDKLFLPGLRKLKRLMDTGALGRLLAVRGEFGYWVFEGDGVPAQRPSWNYRSEDGGGIVLDMFAHWRYVLDDLFGEVRAVSALGATRAGWLEVPDSEPYDNGFKVQWEAFLRHVVTGAEFPWDFLEGAKGLQLAELGLRSWAERRWIDVPEMSL